VKGHVRRRGKKWAIVYDDGLNEQGKRVQRWRGGYDTQKEAQSALNKILESIDSGTFLGADEDVVPGVRRGNVAAGRQADPACDDRRDLINLFLVAYFKLADTIAAVTRTDAGGSLLAERDIEPVELRRR